MPIVMLAWVTSTGQVSNAVAGAGLPQHSKSIKAGWMSVPSSTLMIERDLDTEYPLLAKENDMKKERKQIYQDLHAPEVETSKFS